MGCHAPDVTVADVDSGRVPADELADGVHAYSWMCFQWMASDSAADPSGAAVERAVFGGLLWD